MGLTVPEGERGRRRQLTDAEVAEFARMKKRLHSLEASVIRARDKLDRAVLAANGDGVTVAELAGELGLSRESVYVALRRGASSPDASARKRLQLHRGAAGHV
jgi:DNA-directed RNA polymerase specialized sigma24 family protein